MSKSFWNHKDFGLLDYRMFKKIDVIQASGVGGGSLVYFNVHKRARKEIFELPEWAEKINRDTLDPFYDKAKEMLDARPLAPAANADLPGRTRTLFSGAGNLGKNPELVDIAVRGKKWRGSLSAAPRPWMKSSPYPAIAEEIDGEDSVSEAWAKKDAEKRGRAERIRRILVRLHRRYRRWAARRLRCRLFVSFRSTVGSLTFPNNLSEFSRGCGQRRFRFFSRL